MTDWKKFKITNKEVHKNFNFITFKLDGPVPYTCNGFWMLHQFIFCVDCDPFNTCQVGDYLEIDVEKTVNYGDGNQFDDTSIVRKLGSSAVVPRSNNNLASISQSQASGAIQMLNRAIDSDPRNKYTASMEVDPKTGNVFYHLSGERK